MTTNSTHAPGPWVVDQGYCPSLGHETVAVISESHLHGNIEPSVCIVNSVSQMTDKAWANARLIAAAPELLEALKLIAALYGYLEEINCTQDTWRWIAQVRAAIAKAEGRAD